MEIIPTEGTLKTITHHPVELFIQDVSVIDENILKFERCLERTWNKVKIQFVILVKALRVQNRIMGLGKKILNAS